MKSIGTDDPNDPEHFIFWVIKTTDFDEKVHNIPLEVEKLRENNEIEILAVFLPETCLDIQPPIFCLHRDP